MCLQHVVYVTAEDLLLDPPSADQNQEAIDGKMFYTPFLNKLKI